MSRGGIAVLAVLLLALTACSSVPHTGPVREGLPSLDQFELSYMFNPSKPVKDADQEAIVRGFVRAAAASERDYEVAREYLTPGYAQQWDPGHGVLVVDGTQQFHSPREGLAVLTLGVIATVDAGGTMTLSEPGGKAEVQFELERVNGQWRISSAPTGVILDRPTFTAVWVPRSVYFWSPDDRAVAETRWVLNRSTMPTQIVRKVLEGPSEAMAEALSTAVPQGTTLTSGSVPVVDGTAEVDLSAELLEADDQTVKQIAQQLASSLQGLPGVTSYQLKVHGSILARGAVPVSSEAGSTVQQMVLVQQGGVFGRAHSGSVTALEMSDRIVRLEPLAVTAANDRSMFLVLREQGVYVVREEGTVSIDQRWGLLEPSLDPLGFAWIVHPDVPSEVTVVVLGAEGSARRAPTSFELAVPWLEGRSVVAVRVSAGGNRLAALVAGEQGSEVLVASIVRDSEGVPTRIGEEATVALWESGSPLDLDWYGDARLAVLTQTGVPGGSSKVSTVAIGQFPTAAGTVSGGMHIGGGGSTKAQVRVLDQHGRLFAPQGSVWQQTLADVELVAKVG